MKQEQINLGFEDKLNEAVDEGKISSWIIHRDKIRRNNVYVEKDYKIESLLSSSREDIVVEIKKEEEEFVLNSSFKVSKDSSIEEFESELEDAIFTCSHSKSKKYELVDSQTQGLDDSEIDYSVFYDEKFIEEFESGSQNVFVAEKLNILKGLIEKENGKVKLNSFEFFNSIIDSSIKTSYNVEKSFTKNKSYMEFILTSISGDKESEHVTYKKINDIYKFDFESFFSEAIENVLETSKEGKASDFKGKILLKDYSAFDFFVPSLPSNAFLSHCSARLKFMEISKYEVGKEVINSKLDKFTVYSNPFLKNNEGSMPYDLDGISAKRICLIRNGVFEQFFGNKQYTEYLGVKPTGPFGVLEIDGGEKSYLDLYEDSDEMIEIVSFASFSPDTVTGDFSAEIRLAYRIKDGIKTPFKGGLFTGNIFKILEEVELSKELIEEAGYYGPKVVKFHKGEIVGL